MKTLLLATILGLLLLNSGCKRNSLDVPWEITKEFPAYGLTLGYYLPGDQLQQIVGNNFIPIVEKNGDGYLMLFIASAQKFYLDSLEYDSLRIAHILVDTENSLNCPYTIVAQNQDLRTVFETYDFQVDMGKVDLDVTRHNDTMSINAKIIFEHGYIELSSLALNNPGESKYFESTKVSGKAPSNFFIGDETYVPIQIDSVAINSEGKNWISGLNLPNKPDKITLNTDFTWDFTFAGKETDSK
jgi:hypothetical protein